MPEPNPSDRHFKETHRLGFLSGLESAAEIAEREEGYPTLTMGECGCGESIAAKIRALYKKVAADG